MVYGHGKVGNISTSRKPEVSDLFCHVLADLSLIVHQFQKGMKSTVAKPGSCVWSCKTLSSAEGASHLGGSGGILPQKIFEISTPKIAIFSNLSIKF